MSRWWMEHQIRAHSQTNSRQNCSAIDRGQRARDGGGSRGGSDASICKSNAIPAEGAHGVRLDDFEVHTALAPVPPSVPHLNTRRYNQARYYYYYNIMILINYNQARRHCDGFIYLGFDGRFQLGYLGSEGDTIVCGIDFNL